MLQDTCTHQQGQTEASAHPSLSLNVIKHSRIGIADENHSELCPDPSVVCLLWRAPTLRRPEFRLARSCSRAATQTRCPKAIFPPTCPSPGPCPTAEERRLTHKTNKKTQSSRYCAAAPHLLASKTPQASPPRTDRRASNR